MKTLKHLLLYGGVAFLVLYVAYNPAQARDLLVDAFDLLTAAVRWAVAQPGRWVSS